MNMNMNQMETEDELSSIDARLREMNTISHLTSTELAHRIQYTMERFTSIVRAQLPPKATNQQAREIRKAIDIIEKHVMTQLIVPPPPTKPKPIHVLQPIIKKETVPQSQLPCRPTWPQLTQSRMNGITKLKRIEDWKYSLPLNRRGERAKILYAVCANSDHRNAHHYFQEDSMRILSPQLNAIYYQQEKRKSFGLDWQPSSLYDRIPKEGGEYAVHESRALPFYLQFIFDQRERLFDVLPRLLTTVSIVLDQLIIWDAARSRGDPLARIPFSNETNFAAHLEALWNVKAPQLKDPAHDCPTGPTGQEVLEVWPQLLECDICVLPSVLLMNKKRTANEWYAAMRLLETEADLIVYPLIQVESRMENKELYMRHLMISPTYVPLDQRPDPTPTVHHEPTGSPHDAIPIDLDSPPVSKKETISSKKDEEMEVEEKEDSESATVKMETTGRMVEKAWQGIQYLSSAGCNLLAPTILVMWPHAVASRSHETRIGFLRFAMDCLRDEIAAGDWNVDPGVFIIKGTNSTRTNVLKRFKQPEEAMKVIDEASREGMKLCAAQPGFILQPSMREGLEWEARTFFWKDEALFTVINDQAVAAQQASFVAGETGEKKSASAAFRMLDLRGQERISQQHYVSILPQLIDFSVHILKCVESHCQLVSCSGIQRVDLGVEFRRCNFMIGQTEDQLKASQPRPQDWSLTGEGRIVRFFVNEVTSTLDINWFSSQTTFPVIWTASYATAQQLLHVLSERAAIRPGGLKDRRLMPPEPELIHRSKQMKEALDQHYIEMDKAAPKSILLDGDETAAAEVKAELAVLECYERAAVEMLVDLRTKLPDPMAADQHEVDALDDQLGLVTVRPEDEFEV